MMTDSQVRSLESMKQPMSASGSLHGPGSLFAIASPSVKPSYALVGGNLFVVSASLYSKERYSGYNCKIHAGLALLVC